MAKRTVFRAAFLTFLVLSLAVSLLTASDSYSFYADIKSIKFLAVEIEGLTLENTNNKTYLTFNTQINNPAEGKILIVRHESDLFVEGEHIRHKRTDFSPNELVVRPYDLTVRQMSIEIPSFKLHLFEKGEVHCRIETSIYIRTPFGQTRISNVHTRTLAVTI